jgi:hypothetical protein
MAEHIADNSIDLTVTSPPYDNLRTYNGYVFDFEAIAAQLWRVTKPGGVVVWVVGDATVNGSETGTSFRQALHFMMLGFNLHDTMIYRKLNGGAALDFMLTAIGTVGTVNGAEGSPEDARRAIEKALFDEVKRRSERSGDSSEELSKLENELLDLMAASVKELMARLKSEVKP